MEFSENPKLKTTKKEKNTNKIKGTKLNLSSQKQNKKRTIKNNNKLRKKTTSIDWETKTLNVTFRFM